MTGHGPTLTGAGLLAVLHAVIPHVHLVAEDSGLRSRRVAPGLPRGVWVDPPTTSPRASPWPTPISPRRGSAWWSRCAIVLHNIPEEFAMALPAVMARRRRFLIGAAAVSAAAEPAGALLRARHRQHLAWPERRVPRVRRRRDGVRRRARAGSIEPRAGSPPRHHSRHRGLEPASWSCWDSSRTA